MASNMIRLLMLAMKQADGNELCVHIFHEALSEWSAALERVSSRDALDVFSMLYDGGAV
jgi:chaperonin GroEL (HSP60 family)